MAIAIALIGSPLCKTIVGLYNLTHVGTFFCCNKVVFISVICLDKCAPRDAPYWLWSTFVGIFSLESSSVLDWREVNYLCVFLLQLNTLDYTQSWKLTRIRSLVVVSIALIGSPLCKSIVGLCSIINCRQCSFLGRWFVSKILRFDYSPSCCLVKYACIIDNNTSLFSNYDALLFTILGKSYPHMFKHGFIFI